MPQSRPSIAIRLATAIDLPAIVSITNAAFAIETFLDGTRTDEAHISEMAQNGEFLVAQEDSSRTVASVYVELRGQRGYLGMLAVDPSQQGTGLGKQMVEAAEQHCRNHGCEFVDLSVLSLRQELLPLYRKLGYTEMGTKEFLPPRPLKPGVQCHIIMMSKAL